MYSQSVRHCQFVVSFTHVRTTNAKLFKPLLEGVVKKEIARKISVQVQLDSTRYSNLQLYSQTVRHCWFVVSFTHVRTTNSKLFKYLSEGVVKKEIARNSKCLGTARQYLLFQPPTVQSNWQALLVCRFVSFRLLMCVQQIAKLFKLLGIVGLSCLLMCNNKRVVKKEIARKISVQVQLDSTAIPTSNYSQTGRHCWFVVSFTHVHTTNAKLFKSLLENEGIGARNISVQVQLRQYRYSNQHVQSNC